jgi:hypothetical protein
MRTRRAALVAAALFIGAAALAVGYVLIGLGPHPIDWYRLDAPDSITVAVATGPNGWTWVAGVTETSTTVTVIVKSFDLVLGPQADVGHTRELSVRLAQPLGDRLVYDGTGQEVQRARCPPPAVFAPVCP